MPALRDVVGHDKIKRSLSYALATGRISHAYLFSGPPGVGKKTTGHAFARALLCGQSESDACGYCDDCARSERGVHPDLHIIRPQGGSIKIAQLRALQNSAAYTSFSGGRQVYLVEQAEKMTLEAANCILKILEEPPRGVTFILVADETDGLLPTIRSRCQLYRFSPLPEEEVYRVVEASGGDDAGRARVAARISGGCPGRALAFLEGADKRDQMWGLLARLAGERPYGALLPVDGLGGRDELEAFINCAVLFFRDALVWRITGREELLINVDYRQNISRLAGIYSEREILDILVALEKAARRLAGNVNHRLLLDTLAFKIAGLGDA
jgi:DNA polymerase-3 subunit delta'